jgi:ribokinase
VVIVFGSINLDLIFALPRIPREGETVLGPSTLIQPGGKGANQAVAAALDGAEVLMAGAIGRDALGAGALSLLRRAGVNLERVVEVEASTGCASIVVDPQGANAIAVGSGANLSARASQVETAILGPGASLILQMELAPEQTAVLIERAKATGTRIILNLAPATALPEPALRMVDVLVVNETEGAWLAAHLNCSATAAALHERLGGVAVVRTLGGDGADVATTSANWHQPARTVTVVDTTAAGDCFVGVLANRLDQGASLRDAVERAGAAAALCCTCRGSQASLPTQAETDGFHAIR